jgi:hypothetical protein
MRKPPRCTTLTFAAVVACAALLLLVGESRAQEPPPPPPPAEPAPSGQPPAEPAPAPTTEPPAAEAPAAPTLEDRVSTLEGQVEGISEPFSAVQADVAALKKLKFSGYVQGRYEWHDDANYGQMLVVNSALGNSTVNRETSRFFVRRARLKATYSGTLSEFVLQADPSDSAADNHRMLRDAEASFVINNENPWFPSNTPWEFKLTMGQFKIPFGFEILQSSSDREFPERSIAENALFPGERDRGVRLVYTLEWFKVMAALVNGNLTNDRHGVFDQSSWKDLVGRIGADFEWIAFGFSGYGGHSLRALAVGTAMMPLTTYERYRIVRAGADAQFYYDVPNVGGLTLRGELYWGKDTQLSFSGIEPDAAKCKDAPKLGYYGALVQNIGDYAGVAVRFEQWDPNTGPPDECMDAMRRTPFEQDKVTGLTAVLLGYISGNLKVSVAYDFLWEQEARKRDNNFLTVQMQAKF